MDAQQTLLLLGIFLFASQFFWRVEEVLQVLVQYGIASKHVHHAYLGGFLVFVLDLT